MNLSRRSFIKGAALGVGAAASTGLIAGCSPQASGDAGASNAAATASQPQASEYPVQRTGSMEPAEETFEGDVVVLGCGPGGIACATRLAEEGARVLVVEKTANVGGTGMVASGNCYISLNSRYQVDQGLEADIPAFLQGVARGGSLSLRSRGPEHVSEKTADAWWIGSWGTDSASI